MEERKGTETRRAYIRNLIWFRSGHEAVSSFRSTYFFFYLPARCLFAISSGFSLLQHHRYSSVLWIGTVMALFTNCFPSSVITLSICGLICNHVWPVPPSSPPSSSLPPPVSFLSLFVSSASSTFRPFNHWLFTERKLSPLLLSPNQPFSCTAASIFPPRVHPIWNTFRPSNYIPRYKLAALI